MNLIKPSRSSSNRFFWWLFFHVLGGYGDSFRCLGDLGDFYRKTKERAVFISALPGLSFAIVGTKRIVKIKKFLKKIWWSFFCFFCGYPIISWVGVSHFLLKKQKLAKNRGLPGQYHKPLPFPPISFFPFVFVFFFLGDFSFFFFFPFTLLCGARDEKKKSFGRKRGSNPLFWDPHIFTKRTLLLFHYVSKLVLETRPFVSLSWVWCGLLFFLHKVVVDFLSPDGGALPFWSLLQRSLTKNAQKWSQKDSPKRPKKWFQKHDFPH